MFRKSDWIVYAIVAVIAIALLLGVFVGRDNDRPLTGIRIAVDGKVVAEYDFATGRMRIEAGCESQLSQSDSGVWTIYPDPDDASAYNVLRIDAQARCARVEQANCSIGADCVSMAAIRKAGQMIVCVPHALVIEGIGDGVEPPTSG